MQDPPQEEALLGQEYPDLEKLLEEEPLAREFGGNFLWKTLILNIING